MLLCLKRASQDSLPIQIFRVEIIVDLGGKVSFVWSSQVFDRPSRACLSVDVETPVRCTAYPTSELRKEIASLFQTVE